MNVICRLAKGRSHPARVMRAMADGVVSAGDHCERRRIKIKGVFGDAGEFDVGIQWGRRHRGNLHFLREGGKDVVHCELGCIGDRTKMVTITVNDINGMGDKVVGQLPRWKNLGWNQLLKPWNMRCNRALIIGQVDRDASLWECESIRRWYAEQFKQCNKIGLRPVFRPHPEGKPVLSRNLPRGCKLDFGHPLEQSMEDSLVVTYSSNVGVLAALAGRPVVAMGPVSMIYGWASDDIACPKTFDRKAWLHQMAYTHWTMDEIKSGVAWRNIRRRWMQPRRPPRAGVD